MNKVLINNREVIDQTGVLSSYPIGSLYFNGLNDISPAERFGGNWLCIKENVVLPLGNTAPVTTSDYNDLVSGPQKPVHIKRSVDGRYVSYPRLLSSNCYGNIGLSRDFSNGDAIDETIYFSNLKTDLSNSVDAIIVSIWKRTN